MSGFAVPERVAVVEHADEVYVARLPDGPIHRLVGSAAIIWREAVTDADGPLVERVAIAVGASSHEISADVDDFVATLVERGLLRSAGAERY